jgi:2-iminobutanoate/2-iminopropanoate deaminase
MNITRISEIPDGPPALGPYSPVVLADNFIFISGQTPYDPAQGRISRGTIAEQTQLVLANIERALTTASATKADVVSCRIFLNDFNEENFKAMNAVYGRFFGEHKPTRTTVGAQLLNMDIEIEAIAVRR